ncbi:Transmembrane protein 2 [Ananas comosus]|uniref:Transmembrane protein 2 n=1 Tax=Ananas comosus TaxID=4615 RepID=A0A199V217_ANACO|nr:Transmembrane protein 2 [Ananas comosus]
MDGPVDSLRDPLTLAPHCPRSDSIEPSTTTTTTTTTTKRPLMDPMLWHKVAAVSGVAALGLGTYGAHVFRPKNASYKEVWQTASLYHLVHTVALVGAPFTKRPHIVHFDNTLETNYMRIISARCYTVAYLEDRKYALPAPFGGFAFIAGWASLLF